MFDEYMDRTMLLAMVDKIYDKIDHQEKQDCQKKEQLLYQMILSLLGGEIYHRRCRYRRKRNMFLRLKSKRKEPAGEYPESFFLVSLGISLISAV